MAPQFATLPPDVRLAAQHHRERHRRYELDGAPVVDDTLTWEQIAEKTNGACIIEGCVEDPTEIGHLRSVANGGDFTLDNLAVICADHNRAIGAANITSDMIDHGAIEGGEALVWDAVREKKLSSGIGTTDALVSTIYALASWHVDSFAQIGISAYTGKPGSGKSTCMKIDAAIGRTQDGQIIGAVPSDAALRDQIKRGELLVIDEMRKPTELASAMLNSGYDRSQSKMTIKVSDGRGGFKDDRIDLFGAKIVGGAYLALAGDTMTRVIEHRLDTAPHDPDAPRGWEAQRRREALRERALRWARQTRGAIPKYDLGELPEHVTGRHEQVWGPLIKTAAIISATLERTIMNIAEDHARTHQPETPRSAHTVWHACRIYVDEMGAGTLEKPDTINQSRSIRAATILTRLKDDPDLPEYDNRNFGPKHLWGHLKEWNAVPAKNGKNQSVYFWEDWRNAMGTKHGGGLHQALDAVMEQYGDDLPAIVVVPA